MDCETCFSASDIMSDIDDQDRRPFGWRRSVMAAAILTMLVSTCWSGAMFAGRHDANTGKPVSDETGALYENDSLVLPSFAGAKGWATVIGEVPTNNATTNTTPTTTTERPAPPKELVPPENLHDGNICKHNEEFHAGLCYKKCSLLTGGTDVIRTSPWTCCEKEPCTLNQKLKLGLKVMCTGYAISGDGTCPHKPGSCLIDEEMWLGTCYKKCSILSNQEFTHRVAPATCCKKTGALSCLAFPWKSYTSKEFAVGGGRSGPGACGEDNEMFLGLCYKKCANLTKTHYPHRMGPLTCCSASGTWYPHMGGGAWHMGCFNLRNDLFRSSFNVAGIQPSANFTSVHGPLAELTEKSDKESFN